MEEPSDMLFRLVFGVQPRRADCLGDAMFDSDNDDLVIPGGDYTWPMDDL